MFSMAKPVHKLISPELAEQIEKVILNLKESKDININKIQASKILAWKFKKYKTQISDKELIKILGGE